MKHYFTIQKEMIFKNVEVLIYVFDIENQNEELQVILFITIFNIFRLIWQIINLVYKI